MAASFIAQPDAQVSAYRPVLFRVQSDATSAQIEKLYIRVYNAAGDVLLATYRKDWYTRTGSDPYTFFFEFDIQAILQEALDPLPSGVSGSFLTIGGVYGYATNAAMSVYVKVKFEYRDGDNLLAQDPAELTSDTLTAFNLVRQHEETQPLDPYIDDELRLLLHDAPDEIEIRAGELFSAAFILHEDITTAGFTVRKKDGTVIKGASPLVFSSPATNHNKKVAVVGVGPGNVPNFGSWTGTAIVMDDTVESYEVAFGVPDETEVYLPMTEALTFRLMDSCPGQELRLHWMNDRGGADAFTFDGKRRQLIEAKSDKAERPMVWSAGDPTPHDPNLRGRFRVGVKRGDFWEVETRILYEDVARWLGGLLASPEVYIETLGEDYYLPAVVADGKIEPSNTDEVGAILKFTVELANDKIIQRN